MKLLNELKIKRIFKGDQNLFWDALIADSALAYRLKSENSSIEFTPFIHDEKFGAPDQNLIHCLEKPSNSFFVSEDYADSAGDATYLNLDISYGIFYFPVVEETRLKEYSISLKSISRAFAKIFFSLDQEFINSCSKFGLFLDFSQKTNQSFGKIPNTEELDCFFEIHPEQRIFYIFSRAIGRYGVSPVKDMNILLSSVLVNDTNMKQTLTVLLKEYLMDGILSQSDPIEHEIIRKRFDQIMEILNETIRENGSIADFEEKVSLYILSTLNFDFRFLLNRSSKILSCPENYQIDHFYLNSFIQNNELMSEIYNKSLNQTKMGIQRIRKGETLINIPFYINRKNDDDRFIRTELLMNHITKNLYFKNYYDYENVKINKSMFISGKAIPFLNEFRLNNHLIALPEHGSKYTPACDSFIVNARLNHIPIPTASILRISIHFLDHLKFAPNRFLKLPKILIPYFGEKISCINFSNQWRKIVEEINVLLLQLKQQIGDGKETLFAQSLLFENKTKINKLTTFSKFMDNDMYSLLLDLTEEYNKILVERSKKEKNPKIEKEYKVIIFKIKLIVRFYMQQLIQVHDGLLYLNDRPYSLAIFLMFGSLFIEELIKNVTFRIESV